MPWEFRVGEDIVAHAIPPVFCANDIELETRAVLGGHAIGQLVGVTAAPLVRNGQLVPVLTDFIPQHLGLYVYYGSRAAQPARVRAFIDLAVKMLADNPVFGLSAQELAATARKPRRRRQPAT